jgi:hypothetical protein
MITNSHSILTRWKKHFSHGINYLRQTEIHTAEPLVPEPNVFEVEMAIEKRKKRTNHQVLGIIVLSTTHNIFPTSRRGNYLGSSVWNATQFVSC